MNIKSLLIGSAAALAAVSGAQAADAIVAAEPEPMEYVRVCDAFGTGYFYIPGTETCLKIGGYVRFQTDFGRDAMSANGGDWDTWTRGRITATAKSDTELGELTSFIALQAEGSQDSATTNAFYFDEVYLQLGGFKAGYYLNWWDKGINGETDALGSNRLSSVAYIYTGDAFTAGIQVDELSYGNGFAGNGWAGPGQEVGVEGIITTKFGGVSLDFLASYDSGAEDASFRALLSAAVGPGTLQVAGIYNTGPTAYYSASEWVLAASYAVKASDKLTITPGIQYWGDRYVAPGLDNNDWRAGVTVDYAITKGLSTKVSVQYQDVPDTWVGFVRLQRDF